MTEVTCNDEHGYLQLSEKNDHEIFVHTGNLANWSNLKSRKSNDIPMNELHQSYSRTIEKWIEQNGPLSKKEAFVNCFNAKKMDDNERGLLKVTAKIFLQNFNVEAIKEALNLTLTQLGLKYIDGVYLSLPPLPQNATFSETMLPFWEELERLRDAGLVTQISSCDLDREKLKTLVDIVRVKPEVNQVNLASCCHMPEDLVSYAKGKSFVCLINTENIYMLVNLAITLKSSLHGMGKDTIL